MDEFIYQKREKEEKGMIQRRSIAMCIILSLVTCGIYGLYWAYKQGEKIDEAKTARGIMSSNSGIIYLLLTIFGFGIIAEALMQNELNNMAF